MSSKSLSNEVYVKIKDDILRNILMPGDKLIEANIAKSLKVSRTPVREALQRLQKDGLAQGYPRKSYIVSKISMKETRDLYTVRKSLEPIAVEIIATKGVDNNKSLETIIEQIKVALDEKDIENLKNLTIVWNKAIVDSLDNSILKEVMVMVNTRLYRFVNLVFKEEKNLIKICKCIISTFEKIKERDSKGAKKVNSKMIDEIFSILEKEKDFKIFKY